MSDPVLETLLEQVGARAPSPGEVEIAGRDPVLPTHFRVGEAAAAVLAAIGVSLSDLWELRKGRRQRVVIDVRAAATALLSFAFLRTDTDGEGSDALARFRDRRSVTGLYPARDGRWFFLHGSFPDTQEKALRLLGCSEDPGEVARAIEGWDAQALEDAIAERGLCGARVRTADEWKAHEQGRALSAIPLVEIIKTGESDPEPLDPDGDRPLSGVRVLDLTRVLAGPTCARTLAEHGADVMRIGSPHLPVVPWFVIDTGHGKRSTHLHLKDASDAGRLRALVSQADVFSQGYRGGAMERLGFGPQELQALRPGLIYTSINCYGHVGPWRSRPGWEQLAQTVTGIAAEEGGVDSPRLLPAAATDYTTGYLGALGTLIALARRARDGGSYHVRVSLSQSGMWLMGLARCAAKGDGAPAEIVDQYSTRSDTPTGPMTHLGPVLKLSETPPRWDLPTVPLGTHDPVWLDR